MGQRAVTPDGVRLRELRELKGWSPDDLADACRMNVKTIRRAEHSKGVDVQTLGLIAESLDVPVKALIANHQRRVIVTSSTTLEFENFGEDETTAFVEMIKKTIPNCGEIVVIQVAPGSVIITLEMDEDDAEALRELVANYKPTRQWWVGSGIPRSDPLFPDLSDIREITIQPIQTD